MTYTIIAGVNGVGKSSLTGVLKAERNDLGHIINVDEIVAERGCTPVHAGRIAVQRIDEYLSKNISFTQETTLSGQKTVNTAKLAKEKGYTVRMFYVGLNSLDESLERIKKRVEKGGHDIERGVVEKRYKNRFVALDKILPYCNEAEFYGNEYGFCRLGSYKNGELFAPKLYQKTKQGVIPYWLTEFVEYSRFLA